MQVQRDSHSLEQTQSIAQQLARACVQVCDDNGFLFTLEGQLGAGKTTFTQYFIQSMLPDARVKSPTYALIESYEAQPCRVHHLDLYRLNDPEELEYIGLRELFWHSICLIEWASRAGGWLPTADIALTLQVQDDTRSIIFRSQTPAGEKILRLLT